MMALRAHTRGRLGELTDEQAPVPEPAGGEALVARVDVVIDTAGGDITARSGAVLRPGGSQARPPGTTGLAVR